MVTRLIAVLGFLASAGAGQSAAPRIPILYSTDLFHPHVDPDDHYDLACLFALPELDIRGIILDQGATQTTRMGRPAILQMIHITGRRVPYVIGLSRRLRSRTDPALDEPAFFQSGVHRILTVLRESKEQVTLFTTGSCRDVAVAFNREPDLLKEKVKAIYLNIGNGPGGLQNEWNVDLDPAAFLRLVESGLPLYWCPCFGKDGYATHYVADQAAVVGACSEAVRNFFVYCLTKSKDDAVRFLASGPHPLPTGPRNMWCTAPMVHAAGRRIYQRAANDFLALPPAEAEKMGLAGEAVEVFQFVPMRAEVEGAEAAPQPGKPPAASLRVELNPKDPNGFVFRAPDPRYKAVLASCLKNLLAGLGR